MPNNSLVDQILALGINASPSERLILKIAAALVKQPDGDYDVQEDDDPRIHLNSEEKHWLPDKLEIWAGVPVPKDWAIPERLAANEKADREIEALQKHLNCDYYAAWTEYKRRRKAKRERK